MALELYQLPHPFSGMHCLSSGTIHNFPYLYLKKNFKGLCHEDIAVSGKFCAEVIT